MGMRIKIGMGLGNKTKSRIGIEKWNAYKVGINIKVK